MSQLLKHYLVNRDTGEYALTPAKGYMYPNIKDLNIVHRLSDENNIEYCLSTCPEYFEYTIITSTEGLSNLENKEDITIISSSEIPATEPTEENPNPEVSYEVTYQQIYTLTPVSGLQILTQEEWDAEIILYDIRQEQKRFDLLRPIRDEILFVTDWIVIKAKEQGTNLSAEFKTWRQELRDLPTQTPFPLGFPTLPTSIETDEKVLALYARWSEITQIPMINDPLPAPEE